MKFVTVVVISAVLCCALALSVQRRDADVGEDLAESIGNSKLGQCAQEESLEDCQECCEDAEFELEVMQRVCANVCTAIDNRRPPE